MSQLGFHLAHCCFQWLAVVTISEWDALQWQKNNNNKWCQLDTLAVAKKHWHRWMLHSEWVYDWAHTTQWGWKKPNLCFFKQDSIPTSERCSGSSHGAWNWGPQIPWKHGFTEYNHSLSTWKPLGLIGAQWPTNGLWTRVFGFTKRAQHFTSEKSTVYYRQAIGSCSCKLGYDGQTDLLFNLDNKRFSYGLLFQYLHLMVEKLFIT